jgi:hypothetical protein
LERFAVYFDAMTEADTTSEFKVTLGVAREEIRVDGVQLDALIGLKTEDLDELSSEAEARVSLRPGSVGVGAAGPGIELILTYASIPSDVLALMEIGRKVKSVIKRSKIAAPGQ